MRDDVPDWVMRESHSVRTYITAEYDGETTLDDVPLDSGRLEIVADANIPGRLDLSIPSRYAPTTWRDPVNIYGQRLSVRQVLAVGGQEWTVPLGVYRVQAFDHRPPSMSVEALSLEQLIADYRFDSPYQRPSNATYASTLRALCRGLLPVDTSALPDRALPASLTTDWEAERLAAVRGLQTSWPCDLRVDPDGVLVASPERVVNVAEPDVTWTHGESDAYVTLGGSGLRDEIYNSVVARGEKPDGTPVQATVVDDDPASPTYFYGPYGRRQRFYESPLITTVSQAETAARTVLRREQRRATRVVVEAPPDPRVEVLDTARVTTGTGLVYTGQVVSIELPLTPLEGAAIYEVAVSVVSTVTSPPPTIPSPSPPQRGALPIGDAVYDLPVDGVYVDPVNGADSNPGTVGSPKATVAAAVSACPDGGTVVLRAGIYHEGGNSSYSNGILFNKPGMTVQNYPREAVWFDGSSVVTGWTQSGSVWTVPWTIGYSRDYNYSQNSTGDNSQGFVDEVNWPCAHMPDQVFIDGTPLQQVLTTGQVVPGTFHYDPTGDLLTIGTNPTGREVRVSDKNILGLVLAEDVTIRGIGVRRYANPLPMQGALRIHRARGVFENIVAEQNATAGLGVIGPSTVGTGLGGWNATFRYCTSRDNGLMGLHLYRADGVVVDSCIFDGNNREHFNSSPSAGGCKITRSQVATFDNCQFNNNINSPGLWLDEVVYNSTITRCDMQDNGTQGLCLEISELATVADCVMTGNGTQQMLTLSTDNVTVWCCTMADNDWENVVWQQDNRDPMVQTSVRDNRLPDSFYQNTCTWWMDGAVLKNCVVGESRFTPYRVKQYNFTSDGYTPLPSKGWAAFGIDQDGNLFNRSSGSTPANLVGAWSTGVPGTEQNSGTMAAWQSNSTTWGRSADGSSMELLGGTVLDTDYMLTPDSLAATVGVGRPLPSDIAALIGQNPGDTHLGAWR